MIRGLRLWPIVTLAITIVIEVLAPDPQAPGWFNVASTIGVLPVAALGGRLSR